jgi:hypothetical protein
MFNWKVEESMLRFLKMMVAEDVTITEEVLEVLVAEEVQLQEEKETLLQEEKAQAGLEVIVIQLQEKVVSEEEVPLLEKVVLEEEALHQELVVFLLTEVQEAKVHQKEHQEDQKVLEMLQEKEDQEKANIIC